MFRGLGGGGEKLETQRVLVDAWPHLTFPGAPCLSRNFVKSDRCERMKPLSHVGSVYFFYWLDMGSFPRLAEWISLLGMCDSLPENTNGSEID